MQAVCEQHVLYMVTCSIELTSHVSFHRSRIARGLIEDVKQPNPYIQEFMKSIICN